MLLTEFKFTVLLPKPKETYLAEPRPFYVIIVNVLPEETD